MRVNLLGIIISGARIHDPNDIRLFVIVATSVEFGDQFGVDQNVLDIDLSVLGTGDRRIYEYADV